MFLFLTKKSVKKKLNVAAKSYVDDILVISYLDVTGDNISVLGREI